MVLVSDILNQQRYRDIVLDCELLSGQWGPAVPSRRRAVHQWPPDAKMIQRLRWLAKNCHSDHPRSPDAKMAFVKPALVTLTQVPMVA
ncbi:hypothetical protein PENSUB_13515 [Penicillium subrubescens]|uniref:Uncharacterized protein n=1 Tax=Penicillium subrubescens TaxID=1316194 RepID=A0A1Q5SQZ0_9EURO|nr:hypothetical protein PENSUB_13515 [Penicillium subrubescens]